MSWWNWGSSAQPQVQPDVCPVPAKKNKYNPADPAQNPLNPQGLKPCCACPDTKSARDECFLNNGDAADEKCKGLVAQHKACMASYGFNV
ncbi:COX17-domain-containing protein [Exidia glandulosa HHB12029]|uniref:COX17-domain-containing protein n=1 Tax=Exidia glandulosa HHB12029 TaxID=1314781 RepID=A0A165EC96_EXIGL|nr:COX17-domain-containing protein [Exidia glandulosa HHB12029]